MSDRDLGREPETPSREDRLLRSKMRAAKRALLAEKLWPRIWLPLSVAGVFYLLSLLDVWPSLSPRIHLSLLWGLGIAFAASLVPLLLWRKPSDADARARLEKMSGLRHRPLTAFQDTLTQGKPSTETGELWEAHRSRMSALLKRLTPGSPRPRTDHYDPFAFRMLFILALIVVGVATWGSGMRRVEAAFNVPEAAPGADFRLDVWITPPAYTRKEPIMLANGGLPSKAPKDAVAVPAGSILSVKMNGADARQYKVTLSANEEAKALEPTAQSTATFTEYASPIDKAGTLVISRTFASDRSWTLNVIPDLPPKIVFAGPIEITTRGAMIFRYKAEDDYGVIGANARIERSPDQQALGDSQRLSPAPRIVIGKAPNFNLSLPRTPVKSGEGKTFKELTSHPWAGLPVVVTLAAKDEAGQEGLSAARGLILPERKFTKPLARAVISQRKMLVENTSNAATVAQSLDAITVSAQDEALGAPVYLMLRSAIAQVRAASTQDEFESAVEQLWLVATRIEDGNLSEAERELRAAQDRLKDAIEKGAPPEEMQKLIAELRSALNKFLRAMAEKGEPAKGQKTPNAKSITQQDLQKLLNKIESLTKSGSPDAAQQMLSELRSILESLQAAQQGGQGGGEGQNAEGMKQIDKLSDLMRRQQQLLDQTFRAQQQGEEGSADQPGQNGKPGQQGQGNQPGSGSAGDMGQRQSDLQRELQDLLSQMPAGSARDEVQRRLGEAEKAMGGAADALSDKDLGQAGEQETAALDGLRQGTRSLAEQMLKQAQGQRPGGERADRDPLGRAQGSQITDPGDGTKIPDEIDTQRAREILDELRKRLGQPTRSQGELDYLERLIKQF